MSKRRQTPLSQTKNAYARPHPETLTIAEERQHLRIEHGVIRCDECGAHITIDPSYPHPEYGHRKQWDLSQGGGRCSHRPEQLDEKGSRQTT